MIQGVRFPEAVPVCADQHPEPSVVELNQSRFHRSIVVSMTAEVNNVALLPAFSGICGYKGREGVSCRLAQEQLNRHHDVPGLGFNDVDQSPAVAFQNPLAIDQVFPPSRLRIDQTSKRAFSTASPASLFHPHWRVLMSM